MDFFVLCLSCTASLLYPVYSHKVFQPRIPNGENVPDPCDASKTWDGVGHFNMGGGGPRNPFGLDFKDQGFVWTETLCNKDSDNDGKTNGVELGDPDCNWQEGDTFERQTGLSHPGFNENTVNCSGSTTTKFECEYMDDETISIDVLLDNSTVPPKETTYMCQVIDLKDLLPDNYTNKDLHLIAAKAAIDNANVMHHVLLYGCTDGANIEQKDMKPDECFMNRIEGCEELIAIWAIGADGICYQKDAGFLIGTNGYKKAMLELHWNNPFEQSGYTDGSGITIFLTSKLRQFDAGMIMIGQTALEIPPGLKRYTANSTCSSECTERLMTGPIKIVGALNHMHSIGSAITSQMVTETGNVIVLSKEDNYDYNSPKFLVFEDPLHMEPGYKLQLTCHYNSSSRDETTSYGLATSDEMCFAFIMYYPKGTFTDNECFSHGAYDECDVFTPGGDFCDFNSLGDVTHPETAKRNDNLYSNCEPGYCKEGCLDVVRNIFEEPCFKGRNFVAIKEALRYLNETYSRLGFMDFLYRIDSCNTELVEEQCWTKSQPEDECASSWNPESCMCKHEIDVTPEKNPELFSYCEPGLCNEWCLNVVRDMFKDPCFQGHYLDEYKRELQNTDVQEKLKYMEFLYRLESCNRELADDRCKADGPDVDGAISANMASSAFIVMSAILVSRL